jgi:hypothetical protein
VRNKFPSFIALFCIFVYAGSVLFGAYRLYVSIQSRRALAVRELDAVENLIAQNSSRFYTEPFRAELRERLSGYNALRGVIITGSQGTLDFEKEPGTVIVRDPNPRFIPHFGHTTLEPRQLVIPGSQNVQLYSTLSAVNYEYAAHVLRQTLLAILGALLISFLTMMITMLVSRAPAPRKEDESADNMDREPIERDLNAQNMDSLEDDFFDLAGKRKATTPLTTV